MPSEYEEYLRSTSGVAAGSIPNANRLSTDFVPGTSPTTSDRYTAHPSRHGRRARDGSPGGTFGSLGLGGHDFGGIPEAPPPASLADALARYQDDYTSSYSEDLGDHADEHSRRLSGVPLYGSPKVGLTAEAYQLPSRPSLESDSVSLDTLVHQNSSTTLQHPLLASPSPRRASGTFWGARSVSVPDSPTPNSPRETFQARTARVTPEGGYDDYLGRVDSPPESPPNFPRALRTHWDSSWVSEPRGNGLARLTRRHNQSLGDSASDLAYDEGSEDDDEDDDDYLYDKDSDSSGKHRGFDPRSSDWTDDSSMRDERARNIAYSSALEKLHGWKDSPSTNVDEEITPMDSGNPRDTGAKLNHLDEQALEKEMLSKMDYRARRKHLQRIRIEYNIASIANRQVFLLKLARALMTFGAPSHRIESQLTAAARILEVQAEFIHLPGVIISSFGEQDTGTSETYFVKATGRLSLGSLHKVHRIYRSVVHDEVSASLASQELDRLMVEPPIYGTVLRCCFAFWMSALICPLAFGGSFVDMWFSGLSAFVLAFLQLYVANKSALYANVFEITVSIIISFVARGLSAIRSQIFCYTAISSSGIIGILPGFLILTSSLELASKNIINGSVKMVYALIYTLFLGFGLQIGNDFYLLLDPRYRRQLEGLKDHLAKSVSIIGTWSADNGTAGVDQMPLTGTFTFTHTTTPKELHIIDGCYRPPHFPWYLQPFPLWSGFIIVPLFSLISSLANLQPMRSKELPVMIVISCASYAANKVANHYIFDRSDVVSAIGAFTVGLLGNIYSRKLGGTAFTSMVTGVLFLVPSGLSSAGGITANGNGIDIGGAMIAVTIGITVGLFMSQSIVYTFGSRKNAAVFSF